MLTRTLGTQGLRVSAIGFGCMGLSGTYGGTITQQESIRLIRRAVELGYTLFDTAELYGPYLNEELVGHALHGMRERVTLSTKFGFTFKDGRIEGTNSHPAHIVRSVEGSLKRLQTEYIDILFQHRVDPNIPIEDVVGEMAKLVAQGKVLYLGLSEAGVSTIRRAHAIHPISVLQSEYSLVERGLEKSTISALAELNIGLMPFSPLGRGIVSGHINPAESLPKSDYRRLDPRYQGENFARNKALISKLEQMAADLGVSGAQLALAWLLNKGSGIAPIVGTTRPTALEENAKAVGLALSDTQMEKLDNLFPVNSVSGERYPPSMMRFVDNE
jgi:aryl-alcohol dehydrogenase-like predicted oxidoreductase